MTEFPSQFNVETTPEQRLYSLQDVASKLAKLETVVLQPQAVKSLLSEAKGYNATIEDDARQRGLLQELRDYIAKLQGSIDQREREIADVAPLVAGAQQSLNALYDRINFISDSQLQQLAEAVHNQGSVDPVEQVVAPRRVADQEVHGLLGATSVNVAGSFDDDPVGPVRSEFIYKKGGGSKVAQAAFGLMRIGRL